MNNVKIKQRNLRILDYQVIWPLLGGEIKKGILDRLVARIKAAKALNRQDISNDQRIEKASIPLSHAGYKFNFEFLRNLIGISDKE